MILPDTASSARWESFDRPQLKQAFERGRRRDDIQNAEGDAQRFQTIADQMITSGVTVLAIVNLDSASGAADRAARPRRRASRPSTTTGSRSAARPTTTSPSTTRRSASCRARASRSAWATSQPNIVYLNGSPDDNNATLFSAGRAQRARQDRPTTRRSPSRPSRSGTPSRPRTIFEQMYTQAAGQDRRRARGQRHPRQRGDRDPEAEQRPARSRSPVRTRPSRACRTSSPATSA